MKKMISLIALLSFSDFSFGQSIEKQQKNESESLKPAYYPRATLIKPSGNSSIAPDNQVSRQYWWPGFYNSFQRSILTNSSEKKGNVKEK